MELKSTTMQLNDTDIQKIKQTRNLNKTNNLTLSDPITVELGSLQKYKGQYLLYNMRRVNKTYYIPHDKPISSFPSMSKTNTYIYTGRFYNMHNHDITLNIKDIIENIADNGQYMLADKQNMPEIPQDFTNINEPKHYNFRLDPLKNTNFDINTEVLTLTFGSVADKTNYNITNIRPHIKAAQKFIYPEDIIFNTKEEIKNMLEYTSDVYPVIPRFGTANTEFYIGGVIFPSIGYKHENYMTYQIEDDPDMPPRTEYEEQVRLSGIDINNVNTDNPKKPQLARLHSNMQSLIIPSKTIYELQKDNTVSLVLTNLRGNTLDIKTKIADFDKCNAEYYVMWSNRAACWQCQPFNKINNLNEKINTQTSTDYNNTSKVIGKDITYTWILNSDWIDYKQYMEFESLLISPTVQLYDVKFDKLYDVIVKTSQWSEKNANNCKKPFNLKIELELAQHEKILS